MKEKRVYTAKSVLLSLAIAIVFVILVAQGISTFGNEPRYDSFCNFTYTEYSNQSTCEAAGGLWNQIPAEKVAPAPSQPIAVQQGYCNLYSVCEKEFQTAREEHSWKIFIIVEIIAILAILFGAFTYFPSISTGLMSGGVILIIYSIAGYWGNLKNSVRLITIAIILIILLFVALKKFKK